MNLRDLHYLVAVANLSNFSKAAEHCHISQPTLSNQIKKLEETLDITIFERTNKRVMLTPIGAQIVDSARRILREEENIHHIAQLAHDPFSGAFKLGAFPTVATYIFPKLVPHVKQNFEKLKLILVEEKTDMLLDKLRNGALDAAILALPLEDDYFSSVALFEDEFKLAVPTNHPLTKHSSIKQKDLANHTLLLLEEGHCLRDQALEVCQLNGLEEDANLRATGLETLRQMVKAGTGITFMPSIAIQPNEEDISYIPFATPAPKRTIGLVWRKTSARTALIEALAKLIT